MVKPNIFISFRVTTEERLMLQNYCEQTGRGQSDVLREFVRSLETYCVTESAHDSASLKQEPEVRSTWLRHCSSRVFGIFLINYINQPFNRFAI